MHFYIGDTPGALPPVVLSSLPLDGFTTVLADLIAPDGTRRFVPVSINGEALDITLPVLEQEGIHTLQLLLGNETEERAAAPIRIPVESLATPWHTIDSARKEWQGAPSDDAVLYELLVSSREQVLAFAPAVVGVPVRYRAAQLMQARNTWNGYQRTTGSDSYGSPEFTVTVFPLDWHVRQLLRPQTGTPVVG